MRVSSAAVLLAAGLSGCGAMTQAAAGPGLFATHCSTCHSISGPAAIQKQGGDLRNLRLPRRELLQYAAEMPVVHGRMSHRDLQAVVEYVRSVEQR
jgi:mono/diheme cytochrome c family protein